MPRSVETLSQVPSIPLPPLPPIPLPGIDLPNPIEVINPQRIAENAIAESFMWLSDNLRDLLLQTLLDASQILTSLPLLNWANEWFVSNLRVSFAITLFLTMISTILYLIEASAIREPEILKKTGILFVTTLVFVQLAPRVYHYLQGVSLDINQGITESVGEPSDVSNIAVLDGLSIVIAPVIYLVLVAIAFIIVGEATFLVYAGYPALILLFPLFPVRNRGPRINKLYNIVKSIVILSLVIVTLMFFLLVSTYNILGALNDNLPLSAIAGALFLMLCFIALSPAAVWVGSNQIESKLIGGTTSAKVSGSTKNSGSTAKGLLVAGTAAGIGYTVNSSLSGRTPVDQEAAKAGVSSPGRRRAAIARGLSTAVQASATGGTSLTRTAVLSAATLSAKPSAEANKKAATKLNQKVPRPNPEPEGGEV